MDDDPEFLELAKNLDGGLYLQGRFISFRPGKDDVLISGVYKASDLRRIADYMDRVNGHYPPTVMDAGCPA